MLRSNQPHDEEHEFYELCHRNELLESCVNGVELRNILYMVFGLKKSHDCSLLDTLSFGLELSSIHLGEKSCEYSLRAIDGAMRNLLGDMAGIMVINRICKELFFVKQSCNKEENS